MDYISSSQSSEEMSDVAWEEHGDPRMYDGNPTLSGRIVPFEQAEERNIWPLGALS